MIDSIKQLEDRKRRILIIGGFGPSLINFRGPLLRAMRSADMNVVCTAPEVDASVSETLNRWGVRYLPIPLKRNRVGLLGDLLYWRAIYSWCRRERPDMVLAYTVKPIVYGLSAARAAGVHRRFALVTGLGYAFTASRSNRHVMQTVVTRLYSIALSRAELVFFQNPDDRDEFLRRRLVLLGQTCVVNGSGIDLEQYRSARIPAGPPIFLLIARMIADKGIYEFVEAARRVRMQAPGARFTLVGPTDTNPAAISTAQLAAWQQEGVVRYKGAVQDVRPIIAQCSIYVLPSYREGTPRSSLEAMAMGRPVITTDVPGCRETVEHGVNGFLVPPRDASALAEAMMKFVRDPALAARMGAASRRRAEEKYDVHAVNARMLERMRIP